MRLLKLLMLVGSIASFSSVTQAQTDYVWIGASNNLWSDPNNWAIGGFPAGMTPQTGDNIIFDNSAVNICVLDIQDLDGNADPDVNTFGSITFYSGFSLMVSFGGVYNISASTLTVNGGTFDCSGGGTLTISGSVIINGGNFYMADASGVHSFGSITNTSGFFDGGIVGQILVNGAVVINGGNFTSTSGELTIENPSTTILSLSSGLFNANSGLVSVSLLSNSINNISSGITFNNLTLTNPSTGVNRTISLGSGTTTINGILSLTASSTRTLSISGGGTINILGDLDISGHTGTGSPSHNCTIAFVGTSGTSNLIGSSAVGMGRLPNITINQSSSASLVISDFINLAGNWNYLSNTIVSSSASTLTIYGTRNLDATNNSATTMSFNDLNIGRTGAIANVTLTGALGVNGNLTINASSTLNTSVSNFAIILSGNFSNLGTFTPNSSSITLSGSNSQNLDFRNTTTPTLHSLISSKPTGTANITDLLNISNMLQCTGGTLALGTNLITLLSTSTNTAQVGNSTGGTYTGTVNVQRYIPSIGRRWRFLAAPITNGATVANSWRNSIFITGPGTGTGPVGFTNYNSNGFDWTLTNAPTIYTYGENQSIDFNNRWVGLPSATTALNRGIGYRVFIRGDRSDIGRINGTVTTQNEVTISANGGIPYGNINLPITCSNGCGTDDGWNLIGNPYPATLDWNSLQLTNSSVILGSYTVLNPASNTYETWNGLTGSAGQFISSGQAFWVKSTSASANLSLTESNKATSQSGGNRFKSGSLTNHLMITLSGIGFSNKAFIHQNTTGAYGPDNYDAVKFGYDYFQIATFEPGTNRKLDINNLPIYGAKIIDTIEVEVNLPALASNYQLSFDDVNSFNSTLKVYLQDKLLNTIQDLSTANTYSFATNGSSASIGNRFRVLITNQTNPLPVLFTALEAKLKEKKSTELRWSTFIEKNNAKFVIERSIDMLTFKEIGLVKALGNSSIRINYTFEDNNPEAYTTNYYRIKQVDNDNKFSYSNIASITTDIKGYRINTSGEITTTAKVFPIPTNDILNIEQLDGSKLSFVIIDVYGIEVLNGTAEINQGKSIVQVSTLANGIYFLVAKTDIGQITKTRFLVE